MSLFRLPLPSRFVVSLLLTGGLLSSASAADLSSLRVADSDDHTRAVLDLSSGAEYRLFTLDNPARVVVDIDGSRPRAGFSADGVSDGLVRNVRTGRQGRDLRVVFDLHADAQAKSFLLPPSDGQGHRLVIDLYPKAAQARVVPVKTIEQALSSGERDLIVAIDAGHGGKDPGAIGPKGTHEKTVTLQIARELKRQIDAQPGMKAVLTRAGDSFIPLTRRYELAREAEADLFVSIHADAVGNRTAAGSSVYVLSTRGATSEAARWLAERENSADLVGGIELGSRDDTLAAVLLDLSQSGTMKASEDVADEVLGGLKGLGKVHSRQVQRANFVVLRSPDVPSLLVETAFISNPAEEQRLRDPRHQKKLASAVVEGVKRYFGSQPPPGTWFAAQLDKRPAEHVVTRGETLSGIAASYGVSLGTLRTANGLSTDMVRVGAKLRIPGGSG